MSIQLPLVYIEDILPIFKYALPCFIDDRARDCRGRTVAFGSAASGPPATVLSEGSMGWL